MAVKVSVVMAEINSCSKACVLLSNLGNGPLAATGIFYLLNFPPVEIMLPLQGLVQMPRLPQETFSNPTNQVET